MMLGPATRSLLSWLEHHSNIVPWQILCEQTGATLKVAPINDRGEIDLDAYHSLLSRRTKIVAVGHVSNALGTINPVRAIIEAAHARGAAVLIDGAQAVPHLAVDVQALDCDFYVFSSHKMFGPTGTGVLYGRRALLEAMPPYRGGGDMIASVTFEKTTYNAVPYKFEAGHAQYRRRRRPRRGHRLSRCDRSRWPRSRHEDELLAYAHRAASRHPGHALIGEAREKTGVLSFVMEGVHPHDVGTILDREGIAVRTGQHCAQPVMDRFGMRGHRPSVARHLQHARGHRRAGRVAPRVREVFG